jgi:predicted dehydrogenase
MVGPITRVNGSLRTLVAERRDPATGRLRPVENEDVAHVLVEFAGGIQGTIDISRSAAGYKCGLRFSVFGSLGTIEFDQERMNELRLYRSDDAVGRRGFRRILTGPEHPDYRAFCPAPGHGLGYNDLKVIEVRNVIEAVAGQRVGAPDFAEGWRVQQVVEAIERSHAEGRWVEVVA